jgi:hypothetical protein
MFEKYLFGSFFIIVFLVNFIDMFRALSKIPMIWLYIMKENNSYFASVVV